jgi:hypothetical protein
MSTANQLYTKGSLLKELNLANLVRNRIVDGVVMQGQSAYAWTKIIEGINNKYEANGTGHKILQTYKDEIAYTGDPTVKAQIQATTDLGGGVFRINLTSPSYNAFRENDLVDLKFGQNNLAKVIEAGPGYIKISQAPGNAAPVIGNYATGKIITTRTRAIGTRGTKSPVGLNPVPQKWENYLSIIDDASQQNLFDSQNNTVISGAEGYIISAPIQSTLQNFFRINAMNQFVSSPVNPESNGFDYTSTAGIHTQLIERGNYLPLNTVITRSEFEQQVRRWYIANPASNFTDRVIFTGAIGMAQIAEWYRDQLKYDGRIAVSFTDGSVNGLNATKIFIPGFEYINIVMIDMLNMAWMGELSSIAGYEGLPKTAGNFYFMDFSPVVMQPSGLMGPAFQKIYFKSKYFYSYQRGLTEMATLGSIIENATPITADNMEITSTDNDFNNFRIYSVCGINVMNAQAHVYLENKV